MNDQRGLTVVEILVALVMLAVMSAAIIGSFALLRTIREDASTDVDFSRSVRTALERIRIEWQDPELFIAEQVGSEQRLTVDAYVSEYVNDACSGEVVDDAVVPLAVKLVRVTCTADDGDTQVFEVEFGRP